MRTRTQGEKVVGQTECPKAISQNNGHKAQYGLEIGTPDPFEPNYFAFPFFLQQVLSLALVFGAKTKGSLNLFFNASEYTDEIAF